jgi:hypothetical protein
VWEDGEFCGRDAYVNTGDTEMNHDCFVGLLDFALFAQDYGDIGMNLSGDFNDDQMVDLIDFATFALSFGNPVSPCNPSGMLPDTCAATIALSFSDDSTNVVPTWAQPPGIGRVYVVIDGWFDAQNMEYAIETSANVQILNHSETPYPHFTSTLGTCDPDPQHSWRMYANHVGTWPGGPLNLAYVDYWLTDTDPAWIAIRPANACYGNSRVRWAQTACNRSFDFAVVGNAGINGPAPPGETPCASCDVSLSDIDFGTVMVGAMLDTTFTITNTGSGELSGDVSESCSEYEIVSGGGPFTLNAGEWLDVTVRFAPMACGTFHCTIDTGTELCGSVSLVGQGDDVPICDVTPPSIVFDTLLVGSFVDSSFVITNAGCGTLSGSLSESCPHYSIVSGSGPYSLGAGEFLTVSVRFEPLAQGEHFCTVETGDALCGDVSLSGYGEIPPECAVMPDTLDFGTVPVGSAVDLSFSVTNTGGSVLSGDIVEACSDYGIVSGGGVFNLGGGESRDVVVRFTPAAEGVATCTIDLGAALCVDVFATGVGGPAPRVTSIVDVGNDQGRFVEINLLASSRDVAGSMTPILQYEAFRRIDPLPSKSASGAVGVPEDRIRAARDTGMLSDAAILATWHFAGAIPAHGEPDYAMIAPTLADSTISDGMHWSVFFIRAATEDPTVFFDSDPDSGYSLDNLSPNVPQGFQITAIARGNVELGWLENTEADLRYYTLYRGTEVDFVPDATHRIAYLTTPTYVDEGATARVYHYKLSATDFAGNESAWTQTSMHTSGTGPVGLPEVFAFDQMSPNPVSDRAVFRYELPVNAVVALTVYDVRGRRVRAGVEHRELPAGRYAWEWDLRDDSGTRVPPGIYFHRFEAAGSSWTVKSVVLR